MKYVEWCEPRAMGELTFCTVTCSMSTDDAIRWMKHKAKTAHSKHPKYSYKNNQQALEDFITIYWATLKDIPDVCTGGCGTIGVADSS